MSSTEKCLYFDKGFCKLKGQCPKMHPTSDCHGQCDDKKSCPSRHRVVCKNGNECIFLSPQACEFVHNENFLKSNESIKSIQDSIVDIKGFVKGIDEKIDGLDIVIEDTQIRLSAMEKDVYRNNLMENKIKQLEKDNLDLKTKQNAVEILLSEKIDALLNMNKINNPTEDTGLTDPAVPPEVIVEQDKTRRGRPC